MPMLDRYEFFQEAYFVNDVEEACEKWARAYNAGPFIVVPHHKTDAFMYRGTDQEADVTYGFGYLGEMMIQFIQQHDDTPSIYRDMSSSTCRSANPRTTLKNRHKLTSRTSPGVRT